MHAHVVALSPETAICNFVNFALIGDVGWLAFFRYFVLVLGVLLFLVVTKNSPFL